MVLHKNGAKFKCLLFLFRGNGGHGTSLDDDHLMAGNTTICHWSTMGRESDEVLEKEISDKVTSDWKAIYRLELHTTQAIP